MVLPVASRARSEVETRHMSQVFGNSGHARRKATDVHLNLRPSWVGCPRSLAFVQSAAIAVLSTVAQSGRRVGDPLPPLMPVPTGIPSLSLPTRVMLGYQVISVARRWHSLCTVV